MDTVKWPGAQRCARRQLTIVHARQALVSLPDVRWHDPESEEQARTQLQEIGAIVDRALRRVHASSDEAQALKYAQARLTAFLVGWGDPDLIAPTHLAPMYRSLTDALRALSVRLATNGNADPPVDPDDPVPRT
ncbi:hypothetical protein [Amycolatopsis plumensis]|uniref:Uncharacterized protein n=1 Tax=Amycolatopsis plumensis TaxID=236508 RepID=A0ABV5U4S3_9PSEU